MKNPIVKNHQYKDSTPPTAEYHWEATIINSL